MEKMKILNYANMIFETDIDLDEIKEVEVEIISGDEVISVHLKDGTIEQIDADNIGFDQRCVDFYDGYYKIKGKKKLEEWNERIDTYSYLDIVEIQ